MAVGRNCIAVSYPVILVAFFVYQVGTLITTGTLGNGFVPGLIAVAAFAGALLVLIQRNEKAFSAEYRLRA